MAPRRLKVVARGDRHETGQDAARDAAQTTAHGEPAPARVPPSSSAGAPALDALRALEARLAAEPLRPGAAIADAAATQEHQPATAPSAGAAPAAVASPAEDPAVVAARAEKIRILEAVLFASSAPLDAATLARSLSPGDDVAALLADLAAHYAGRGVNLVRVAGKWAFRTAENLGYLLETHAVEERRLSRAALETLAIVAYHQPVTRAEIEQIRGVATSKGTLDVLLETGWVRPRGRRRAPGKPLTYGTTDGFLEHFGLDTVRDLPGLAELKGAGLLDGNLPPGFKVPEPRDLAALMPDELALEDPDAQAELELDALELAEPELAEPDDPDADGDHRVDGEGDGPPR